MFKFRKSIPKRKAHCRFYIVLAGEHNIPIEGITGVALKEVTREMFLKHKGLKTWIESNSAKGLGSPKGISNLSNRMRIELLNRIYGKLSW